MVIKGPFYVKKDGETKLADICQECAFGDEDYCVMESCIALDNYKPEDPFLPTDAIEPEHAYEGLMKAVKKMANPEAPKDDKVNHPNHYTFGEIEVIDYIRDKLSPEEFQGYCEGNVLKYVSRWRHKGGVEDLQKAKVYLQWMIESVEAQNLQGP